MTTLISDTFLSYFDSLEDPRIDNHNKRHELQDILVLTIIAVICGADSWVDIELFGQSKTSSLKKFLHLPHGVPSHDTLGRVFASLNPKQFQSCFLAWTQSLIKVTGGEIIAIDGKTLRRSHDRAKGRGAIHMVSAWASSNELVLGQVKTEEKSNEITAIPELLNLLSLTNSTVTIDAMGCQRDIAQQIVEQQGNYVLALKGNQGTLRDDVQLYLEHESTQAINELSYHETIVKDHGRIEIRRHWLCDNLDWLTQRQQWSGLKGIGMVESERHIKEAKTIERRFYLCSFPDDAERFADAVRRHWGVENKLHWCLDVCFDEDQSRVRTGNAAENFAVVRHIALNILRQETGTKVGLKAKRRKAGWDEPYLMKILTASGF